MSRLRSILLLALLLTAGFACGVLLQSQTDGWNNRQPSDSMTKVLFGESRKLFANHFYSKADVSFHRGYYLSFWDQARQAREKEEAERLAKEGHDGHDPAAHAGGQDHAGHNHAAEAHEDHAHEAPGQDAHAHADSAAHHEEGKFGILGPPTDWIDRFGRHFRITEHTELRGHEAREILPWLRISAELDPQRIETYTVASYWLSEHLGKVNEAEQFLRDGLKANPNSYEILYELGRIQQQHHKNPTNARNVWLVAERKWRETEAALEEPDYVGYNRIAMNLAHLEEKQGNLPQAIHWMEKARVHSPLAPSIQKQIDDLRDRMMLPAPAPAARP